MAVSELKRWAKSMLGPGSCIKQKVTPSEGGGAIITETYGLYGFMKSWFFFIGLGFVWAGYNPAQGLSPLLLLIFAPCWIAGISALHDAVYKRTFVFEESSDRIVVSSQSLFGRSPERKFRKSSAEVSVEGHVVFGYATHYHIVFFTLPGIRFSLDFSRDAKESLEKANLIKQMLDLKPEPNQPPQTTATSGRF